MNYEDVFTDWEKRRLEACRQGFLCKDFSYLYLWFMQRQGMQFAEEWNQTLSKAEKKELCAKMLVLYETDEKIRLKALKWLKGKGVYWDSERGKFK